MLLSNYPPAYLTAKGLRAQVDRLGAEQGLQTGEYANVVQTHARRCRLRTA